MQRTLRLKVRPWILKPKGILTMMSTREIALPRNRI